MRTAEAETYCKCKSNMTGQKNKNFIIVPSTGPRRNRADTSKHHGKSSSDLLTTVPLGVEVKDLPTPNNYIDEKVFSKLQRIQLLLRSF